MSQIRRLAAIMFTDIVGYTALMGNDEKKHFNSFNATGDSKTSDRRIWGTWIKELGDGVMASFNSVTDSVYAAIKIQEVCNKTNEFYCVSVFTMGKLCLKTRMFLEMS